MSITEFPGAKAKRFAGDFLILDIKQGRDALRKRIEAGEKIPITIHGVIDSVWGNDDGTSREFSVIINELREATGEAGPA